MKRLSLDSVGFANTSAGSWPAKPLDSKTEGQLREPAWPVETTLLSKAEAHLYYLIPWGVKLAAIVSTHFCQHNAFYVFTLFIKLCCLAQGNRLFNSNFFKQQDSLSCLPLPFLSLFLYKTCINFLPDSHNSMIFFRLKNSKTWDQEW